ncbi:hypothetical protein CT157_27595 [Pseudomonas syringae]|uniref:DUF1534 domain-containing protein n=1 Tax=Pseudomonas syringae TaxID=317 RepID=A0A3T0K1V8_PSESX|nr:hypothetical protein CT157_27595 [Pseudomonas syringae]
MVVRTDRSLTDRSHAPRGNAARDALRHSGRGASMYSFPRGAWERSEVGYLFGCGVRRRYGFTAR